METKLQKSELLLASYKKWVYIYLGSIVIVIAVFASTNSDPQGTMQWVAGASVIATILSGIIVLVQIGRTASSLGRSWLAWSGGLWLLNGTVIFGIVLMVIAISMFSSDIKNMKTVASEGPKKIPPF